MPTVKITDAMLRNLSWTGALNAYLKGKDRGDKPPPKQIGYIDTLERGLALQVVLSCGGTKTFRVLTYVRGQAISSKLGNYPNMSLKEAKKAAREYYENPAKVRAEAFADTFTEVMETFLKRYVQAKELRSGSEIERALRKHALPVFGKRPFAEIKREDVTKLLDKVEDNSGPVMADRLLAYLSKLMNWYATRSGDYRSPIVPGMRRSDPKARQRKRTLNDPEIVALWQAASKFEPKAFGVLIQTLLVTGQRKAKVAKMKWSDLDGKVWTLATAKNEKPNTGKLQLPQLVLDLLSSLPKVASNPYVFAGERGNGYINSWSEHKRGFDKLMQESLPDMEDWVIHDLRRTNRSLMQKIGISYEVGEAVLGHVLAGVSAVYMRHSYDREKGEALEALVRYIQNIISPTDKVVALRRP